MGTHTHAPSTASEKRLVPMRVAILLLKMVGPYPSLDCGTRNDSHRSLSIYTVIRLHASDDDKLNLSPRLYSNSPLHCI